MLSTTARSTTSAISSALSTPRALVRSPATPSAPSTPAAQTEQQPTPGSWRHPALYEITRRKYADQFDDSHVRSIIINGTLLIASWAVLNVTPRVALLRLLQSVLLDFKNSVPYSNWLVGAMRLLFSVNICLALQPFLRTPDQMADIPLTPSQRKLMDLKEDIPTPQTPGSVASPNYITPPRYAKSASRSSFGTPSDRGSPISSPRASLGMSTSHSPFSPSNGSPLFQKVIGGSASKHLNGSAGNSFFSDSGSSTPSTPTPGAGKASVGLNSKWLYEKRRDARGSSLYD